MTLNKQRQNNNPLKFEFLDLLEENFTFDRSTIFKSKKAIYLPSGEVNDFGEPKLINTTKVSNATYGDKFEQFPCLFKVAKWDGLNNAIKDLNKLNTSYREGCYVTKDNGGEWVILLRPSLLFKFMEWQKNQETID